MRTTEARGAERDAKRDALEKLRRSHLARAQAGYIEILQKNPSHFDALHMLDFPVLIARPALRTILIILLCSGGFVFSMTGVILAWRRTATSLRA